MGPKTLFELLRPLYESLAWCNRQAVRVKHEQEDDSQSFQKAGMKPLSDTMDVVGKHES